MIKKKLKIQNRLGLHARASAKLVQTASKYASHIEVCRDGQTVNCKSIMGVMMLAASQHTWLEVSADGDDEIIAVEAIESLINERFGEAR